MGILLSIAAFPFTVLYSFISWLLAKAVEFIISLPERIVLLINKFYGAIQQIPGGIQSKSFAIRDALLKTSDRISPNIRKAISFLAFNQSAWIIRLPGQLILFFYNCFSLLWTCFSKSLPFLAFWLGVVVFYWFIVWLILPTSIDPTEIVLISNGIIEGFKAVFNGITAVFNLFFDLLELGKVPFNIIVNFIFTGLQYTGEYLSGDLGFSRLGNLKSVNKLKADFGVDSGGGTDNDQFDGFGERRGLEQQVFGADSTFGGFTLSLDKDDPAVRGIAKFYSGIFSALAFTIDAILLVYEIFLTLIAPFTTFFLKAIIGIFTNLSCLVSACKDAKGIGCTVGEFFIVIINSIRKLFGAGPINGCEASAYPNVPCYCSRSEGGFYQSLPSCPIPLYICVNKGGEFTEVEVSTYNGNRVETVLTTGPTREIGCPRSIRSGRLLSIGDNCKDVCHIDETGEGWWINVCDSTHNFKGHCAAQNNKTIDTVFEELQGEVHERHLKQYLQKPWVSRKERRLLTRNPIPVNTEDNITYYEQFIQFVADAYKNMPNIKNSPLDCSKVNPYDVQSIHSILYNSVCVSLSAYDILDKQHKIKGIEEQMSDAFQTKKEFGTHFGRNLKESSASITSHMEYIYKNITTDPSWSNYKKLHIEYVDYATDGEYKSVIGNTFVHSYLNQTAHLLVNMHRHNMKTAADEIQRRNLATDSLINIPKSAKTYICPGSTQRVYQRISLDPLVPGLESCKIPSEWSPLVVIHYFSFVLIITFYTFSPATYLKAFTDCWELYNENPETYPLTFEGINAMITNNNAYLDTKTFCFPLFRSLPRIPTIVWSFLTWVEESCGTEYTIENGQINRCICPQYVISEVLDDTASQWVAFIPLFVKYRFINTYRTLQIVWTLFVPIWISDIWTNIFLLIYPSTPKEVLYVFNKGYARGDAFYWGTNNDLTTLNVATCVLLTIQAPFYFVIWFLFPLYYFTYYIPLIKYILEGSITNRIQHSIKYAFDYINLRRFIQEHPRTSIWSQRMRENPFFALVKYIYSKIIVPCGRDLCPRRVSLSWCPPRPEWEEKQEIMPMTSMIATESSLQEILLSESPGQLQSANSDTPGWMMRQRAARLPQRTSGFPRGPHRI